MSIHKAETRYAVPMLRLRLFGFHSPSSVLLELSDPPMLMQVEKRNELLTAFHDSRKT